MKWTVDKDVRKGESIDIPDETLEKVARSFLGRKMNESITKEGRSLRAKKMWEQRKAKKND